MAQAQKLEKPYFVASECYAGCTDPWCPYVHGAGWKMPGFEGLHATEEAALRAATR